MGRYFIAVFIVLSMISCAGFPFLPATEMIKGIQIVSVEEVEDSDGLLRRLVKGTVSEPLANDEEWLVSVYAIYNAKRLPGQNLTIRIYLDSEKDWISGTAFAVAKFGPKALRSMKIDDRTLKLPNQELKTKP
ncbi:MAG: hypothetical protein K9M49_00640 [Candidatus Marinimicrobia bacterium]|nr:hypothetical protein [Candidatus Neomarinimicrobiota bacterium]MCF7850631.1 hypothetical protein [Candidatus Neomarinimicrobiota bacterium]MCF7903635.1 hypothetical protein [Candidatus Neomarinimicrobiota bacterium]